jgi:hypothetical protein
VNVAENALDNALFAESFTALVMFKVKALPAGSAVDGTKVAPLPEHETLPATAAPLDVSVTLPPLTVEQFTGSEKFTDTVVLGAMPVMLLAGVTLTTVGGVASGTGAGESLPPPQATNPETSAAATTNLLEQFIAKPLYAMRPCVQRRKTRGNHPTKRKKAMLQNAGDVLVRGEPRIRRRL